MNAILKYMRLCVFLPLWDDGDGCVYVGWGWGAVHTVDQVISSNRLPGSKPSPVTVELCVSGQVASPLCALAHKEY